MSRTTREASNDDRRVLVVTQYFPPEGRGGNRWEQFLSNSSDTVTCRVLCPPPSTPFGEYERTYVPWQTERSNGVAVTRLWTYQPQRDTTLGRLLNYGVFSVLASVYVLCNFWRFDCVVTMSTPHTTFLPGAVGKLLGRAWIVDVFDLWLDNAVDLGYVEPGSIGYRVVAWLERVAIERADRVLVITPTMGEYFASKYDLPVDRFVPMPFGVDTDLFDTTTKPPEREYLIYVGNLGTHVAFEPFLEAFARLDERYRLVLVGSGERREELEHRCRMLGIDDRVRFLGVRPREEIPDLLSAAQLSIAPVRTDKRLDYALPYKVIESMAVGTPYVVSDLVETRRLVEESGAGIAVENDSGEVAAAMTEILADERLRSEMGRRGTEYVSERHDWTDLAERVETYLVDAGRQHPLDR